jgi:hypothetical protein
MVTSLLPVYARSELAFERGEGARLFTADGVEYLDFGGGIAVSILGHAHPHLVAALVRQAEKLWHTSNLYRILEGERLASGSSMQPSPIRCSSPIPVLRRLSVPSRWCASTTQPEVRRSVSV